MSMKMCDRLSACEGEAPPHPRNRNADTKPRLSAEQEEALEKVSTLAGPRAAPAIRGRKSRALHGETLITKSCPVVWFASIQR